MSSPSHDECSFLQHDAATQRELDATAAVASEDDDGEHKQRPLYKLFSSYEQLSVCSVQSHAAILPVSIHAHALQLLDMARVSMRVALAAPCVCA